MREDKRHTARRVACAHFADMGEVTPSNPEQGVPHPVLDGGGTWGTPDPDLGWGIPHQQDGVSLHPNLGWGIPPVQQWDEVPPPMSAGWGTPCLDQGWGTPPPRQVWTD